MTKQTNVETRDDAAGRAKNDLLCADFLAEKHTGMKVSASGILNRVSGYLKPGAEHMLMHLEEMAKRYYAGDIKAVDEFLQLYDLDDQRPST